MGFPPDMISLAHELLPFSTVVSSTPLKGGISAEMVLLTLKTAEGEIQRFSLRKPGDWGDEEYATKPEREFRKYQLAGSKGLLAPEPVKCFQDFFVLKFIDGNPNLDLDHAHAYVEKAAQHLAQVHRSPMTPEDLSWLPRANEQPSGEAWRPEVREFLLTHGHPKDEPQTLCHGDCWPGNILWEGDDIVGLIDWEEVHIGSPLCDLAIARLDLLFAFDKPTVEAFTASYLNHNPIDTTHLLYWDLRCSQRIGDSYDEWARGFAALRRPDVTADVLRQKQAEFVSDGLLRLT